uniref:APO domain-containing protein n=1 Tax=Kalanchoe fedtschenkoi TaxID=63787 RepID=A0A7N0V642_KALFE
MAASTSSVAAQIVNLQGISGWRRPVDPSGTICMDSTCSSIKWGVSRRKLGVSPALGVFEKEGLKLSRLDGLGLLDSLKCHDKMFKLATMSTAPSHTSGSHRVVIKNEIPQNADFPKNYSKKEKKPFPVSVVELRRRARERVKNHKGLPRIPVPPPKIGLVVKSLIPVAYEVLNARTTLINNIRKLLKVVTVHGCKSCDEVHVGPVGHPFRSCKGPQASARRGLHDWSKAYLEDILVPVEAYHLFDRLGPRIPHFERFSTPRIPAVVELCIQAGVEIPEFPTKRRRKPIIRINKSEFVDADETDLPDPEPFDPPTMLTELPYFEIVPPSTTEEKVMLAEETLQAWETMRNGAKRLMKMYPVRVCGYCPEIHVGASGHKAQNCGAYKHQQRNGQHGWQTAILDNLIPPKYVWHVPDADGPLLHPDLRSFYGKAPALVELCIQAGAAVPEQYKATMRLDIGIPTSIKEAEMVV